MTERYSELDPALPLLLLPLRLETRSEHLGDGQWELRVRVYPDDVSISAVSRGLSELESAAARDFWTADWVPRSPDDPDPWAALVAAVGPDRAPWVAAALRPTNPAERGVADPVFPEPPTDPFEDAAPRALLLPDVVRVVVEQAGTTVSAVGAPIPVGGIATGGSGDALGRSLQVLARDVVDPDDPLAWLTDFAAAERVGLGIRVRLPHADAAIARVSVVGVRTSADAQVLAADLAWLLTGHRFGDGAALLAPGTITNNTPDSRSAWSRVASRPGRPSPDPAEPGPGSSGRILADALGVPAATFADWDGTGYRGEVWADALAQALWPATWGGFLDRGLRRPLSGRTMAATREHARLVRGRGPLPTLRIGRQPYGVLPVTSLPDYVAPGVAGSIAELLRRLGPGWRAAGEEVPQVARGDLSDVLPQILGQGPVSRSVRVRRAVGLEGPLARVAAKVAPEELAGRRTVVRAAELILGLRPGTLAEPRALGEQRLLGLPYSHESDPEVLNAILEAVRGGPPVPKWSSLLQVLVALSEGQTRAGVDRLVGRERGFAMRERLEQARGEVGDELVDLGTMVLEFMVNGEFDDIDLFTKASAAFDEPGAPWAADQFNRRFPVPALRPHPIDAAGQDAIEVLQAVAVTVRAALTYAQTRQAIATLLEVDSQTERAHLLAETLDCASHRYDAWVTSLATSRLASLRQAQPAGLAVGAYGVVEDLHIESVQVVEQPPPGVPDGVLRPPRPGGAITAPSIAHASTAAVLRGARLTHDPADDVAGALEIDLTSTRARAAMAVLDGVRAGQPLGALAGYRFERQLHDATANHELNAYLPSLRTLAPLVAAKSTDRVLDGPAPAALESVAAQDVVDGVRLRELYLAERNPDGTLPPGSAILARLQNPPPGFTHYVGAGWQPPDAAAVRHLEDALRCLDGLLDAVADLLLAEGVHQLVSGSPARAAAAMDAIAGDAVPAQPDVLGAPSPGAAFTHRLLVLSPARSAPQPEAPTWATHPRAAVDPSMAAWAQSALGPISSIALSHGPDGAIVRLRPVVLTALELIVATDAGPQTLWARLRRAVPGLPEQPMARTDDLAPDLLTFDEAWVIASSLRALLAGSRALLPSDLAMPGTDPGQGRAVDLSELRQRAESAVAALAAVPAAADLPAALVRLADQLARFGISGGVDPGALADDDLAAHTAALLAQRDRRVAAAQAALADYDAGPPERPEAAITALTDVISGVFGDTLPVLPVLAAADESDPFLAAWRRRGVAPPDGAAIRPWLARMARVRPAVARLGEVVMLREAVVGPKRLRVVQLPATGPDRWVGLPFPDGVAPAVAVTSLVIDAPQGLRPTQPMAGVVVDGWTESVPRRRVAADGSVSDLVTAGVAVHANGPDSRAPQALLLAVSPDGAPWTWQRLAGIVGETVDLARARLVTLERAPLGGALLPATWAQDWSLQGEPVIDPRVFARYRDELAVMPYVSEMRG